MKHAYGIYEDTLVVVRRLKRAPGFVCAVIAILALTVGANTTAISLLNAVALRPLPVRDADRLVLLTPTDNRGVQSRLIHHRDIIELAQLPVFETLSLYSGGGILWTEARGTTGEGAIEAVTPGFHEALGLRPFLGRFFGEGERAGAGQVEAVAVISHRFWQRHYGSDPKAIGEQLLINAVPFTVIGVTPRAYGGLYIESGVDFSIPVAVLGHQLITNQYPAATPGRPVRANHGVGHLRAGVSLEEARAAVETAWQSLRANTAPAGLSATEQTDLRQQRIKIEAVTAGISTIWTRNRDVLNTLAGATAVLLVLGCVNLAGLLLARLAARDHELFLHLSLGASGGRISRQLLIEGFVLALLGSVAGVTVAWWASSGLTLLLWEGSTALALSVTPDQRVLTLNLMMVFAIASLIAILPAWIANRRTRFITAKHVTRSTMGWSKALLVTQVALSLALLAQAALFTSSLSRLRGLDSGVRAEGIRWTRLLAQPGGYRDLNEIAYYPELLRRLSAVPGIDAVAFTHHFPAFFNFSDLVTEFPIARSGVADPSAAATGMMEYVSPGFFATIGTPLMQGRDVRWSDDATGPAVAVVNQALSARLFPGNDALGQRIRIGDDPARAAVEIIGIVPDATMGGYRAVHQPVAFRPKAQEPRFFRSPVVVFRTKLSPTQIDQAVATTVSGLGREYVRRMYSFEEQVDRTLNRERLMTWVSSVFGGLAALAAVVGLFSLLAYTVVRRTREIGVRMALGASRLAVTAMVLRDGMRLALLGVAIGIPIALAGSRLTASLLFGVSSSDAVAVGVSVILFILVSGAACLWPAVRASAIAPADALRSE